MGSRVEDEHRHTRAHLSVSSIVLNALFTQAPLSACGVPFECLTFRSAQSAAAITSRPGALDITGIEPRHPYALALGLRSLVLHAGTHEYWAAAFLTYLEFVHAFLKKNSNFYAFYVNTKQY